MDRNIMKKLIAVLLLSMIALTLTACDGFEGRKDAYFAKGKELFEAGDDARARLELKNTLQIDNKHGEAWYLLGRIEERAREFKKAFANYTRAIEFSPDLVGPRVRKGQLLIAAAQFDLAQEEIDAALALKADDSGALIARGTLRARQGDGKGAEKDARAVLAVDPNNAAAAALLAKVQVDRKEVDEAEATLSQAIAANPDDVGLRLILGALYDSQGNSENALGVLRALVEHYPDEVGYRVRLAKYLEESSRLDEAETVLREGVEAMPDELSRQRLLIQFLLRARGIEAAQKEVAKLIERQPDVVALRFIKADLQRSAGDLAGVEETLRKIASDAQRTGPDAVKAQVGIARIMLEAGRDEEAEKLLKVVLEQSATQSDALQMRAMLALRRKQVDQAIADLRTVLRDHPDRVTALRMLGLAYAQSDQFALAQEAYERAIELAPGEPQAYLQLAGVRVRTGDKEGAMTVLDRLLTVDPDSKAAQETLARIQLSGQDWDALAKTAEKITAANPESPLGHYLEGLALQRRGEHREAVTHFEKALQIKPDVVEPLVGLARSYLALNEPEEAKRHVLDVLEDNPDNLVATNLLGDIYLASGDMDQAVTIFEGAASAQPKSPRAYVRLAQVYVAQGDLDAARSTLEKGVQETDRNGFLVLQLALVQEQAGDIDAAIRNYQGMLERFPDSLVPANNLAVILARQAGDRTALDRALELASRLKNSDIPVFLDTLGWVHYQRGEYDAALPYLEKAVAGNPQNPEFRYHLGMAYVKKGSVDAARENLAVAAGAEGFAGRTAAQNALDGLGGG